MFCRTCSGLRMPAIVVLTAGCDRMKRTAISGSVIPAGRISFSLSTRLIVFARFSGPKYPARQSSFGKRGFQRHLAAEAAFIQRHAGNHPHIQFLANGKQLIFRRLVEDVVDHLHHIDQSGMQRLDAVLRLPAVDAQSKEANPSCRVSVFRPWSEIPARSVHESSHT